MKDKQEITEEVLKVPSDILLDIFNIIVKEELKHEVIEVNENRKTLSIVIGYDKTKSRNLKAIQNIQGIISYYNDYRFGSAEEVNWRDN